MKTFNYMVDIDYPPYTLHVQTELDVRDGNPVNLRINDFETTPTVSSKHELNMIRKMLHIGEYWGEVEEAVMEKHHERDY